MLNRLKKTGRGAWLDEEMHRLADPSTYANDPEMAWRKLRLPNRKAETLGRLKALAAWREREAQSKDIPKGRIAASTRTSGPASSSGNALSDRTPTGRAGTAR